MAPCCFQGADSNGNMQRFQYTRINFAAQRIPNTLTVWDQCLDTLKKVAHFGKPKNLSLERAEEVSLCSCLKSVMLTEFGNPAGCHCLVISLICDAS